MKFMLNTFKSDLPINVNLKIQMKCGNTSNTLTGKNGQKNKSFFFGCKKKGEM